MTDTKKGGGGYVLLLFAHQGVQLFMLIGKLKFAHF